MPKLVAMEPPERILEIRANSANQSKEGVCGEDGTVNIKRKYQKRYRKSRKLPSSIKNTSKSKGKSSSSSKGKSSSSSNRVKKSSSGSFPHHVESTPNKPKVDKISETEKSSSSKMLVEEPQNQNVVLVNEELKETRFPEIISNSPTVVEDEASVSRAVTPSPSSTAPVLPSTPKQPALKVKVFSDTKGHCDLFGQTLRQSERERDLERDKDRKRKRDKERLRLLKEKENEKVGEETTVTLELSTVAVTNVTSAQNEGISQAAAPSSPSSKASCISSPSSQDWQDVRPRTPNINGQADGSLVNVGERDDENYGGKVEYSGRQAVEERVDVNLGKESQETKEGVETEAPEHQSPSKDMTFGSSRSHSSPKKSKRDKDRDRDPLSKQSREDKEKRRELDKEKEKRDRERQKDSRDGGNKFKENREQTKENRNRDRANGSRDRVREKESNSRGRGNSHNRDGDKIDRSHHLPRDKEVKHRSGDQKGDYYKNRPIKIEKEELPPIGEDSDGVQNVSNQKTKRRRIDSGESDSISSSAKNDHAVASVNVESANSDGWESQDFANRPTNSDHGNVPKGSRRSRDRYRSRSGVRHTSSGSIRDREQKTVTKVKREADDSIVTTSLLDRKFAQLKSEVMQELSAQPRPRSSSSHHSSSRSYYGSRDSSRDGRNSTDSRNNHDWRGRYGGSPHSHAGSGCSPGFTEHNSPSFHRRHSPYISGGGSPQIRDNYSPRVPQNFSPNVNHRHGAGCYSPHSPNFVEPGSQTIREPCSPSVRGYDSPNIRENRSPIVRGNRSPIVRGHYEHDDSSRDRERKVPIETQRENDRTRPYSDSTKYVKREHFSYSSRNRHEKQTGYSSKDRDRSKSNRHDKSNRSLNQREDRDRKRDECNLSGGDQLSTTNFEDSTLNVDVKPSVKSTPSTPKKAETAATSEPERPKTKKPTVGSPIKSPTKKVLHTPGSAVNEIVLKKNGSSVVRKVHPPTRSDIVGSILGKMTKPYS
jgi:hypothetical protein